MFTGNELININVYKEIISPPRVVVHLLVSPDIPSNTLHNYTRTGLIDVSLQTGDLVGEHRKLPVRHDARRLLRRSVVLDLARASRDGDGVLQVLAGLTRLVVQASLVWVRVLRGRRSWHVT